MVCFVDGCGSILGFGILEEHMTFPNVAPVMLNVDSHCTLNTCFNGCYLIL